ncbi:MAG: response regulator [Candidatus Endonucleobacter sp. (ex Gigantidas childressi)]|nr:response regulator [Candidatus Endonucleobacter sp. (ex Gigantidas childressi)]
MNLRTTATIYLLEPDAGTTKTIRSLCAEKALSLHCFQSDDELMKAMEFTQPSCVIVAMDKPMRGALYLLTSLITRGGQVPVIMLGLHSDIASAVKAIRAGAIDYIEKPTIYGRLAEHLNNIIKYSSSTPASVV